EDKITGLGQGLPDILSQVAAGRKFCLIPEYPQLSFFCTVFSFDNDFMFFQKFLELICHSHILWKMSVGNKGIIMIISDISLLGQRLSSSRLYVTKTGFAFWEDFQSLSLFGHYFSILYPRETNISITCFTVRRSRSFSSSVRSS